MKENYGVNTHNQGVTGSSPVGPTLLLKSCSSFACSFFLRHTFLFFGAMQSRIILILCPNKMRREF